MGGVTIKDYAKAIEEAGTWDRLRQIEMEVDMLHPDWMPEVRRLTRERRTEIPGRPKPATQSSGAPRVAEHNLPPDWEEHALVVFGARCPDLPGGQVFPDATIRWMTRRESTPWGGADSVNRLLEEAQHAVA